MCIGPGATETIFALGAGAKLVGRDQISDYPSETKDIPIAGDYTGPFVEKAIALNPDLVIVQGETYDKTRAENWQRKIGAPVAILVPTSVEKVARGMEKIGVWLGDTKKPHPGVQLHQDNWLDVRLGKSTAFFEVQRSPLWTAGKGTLIDDLLKRGTFENVFRDVSGYKQINLEMLLARQPAYYVVSVSEIKSFTNWKQQAPRLRARVLAELRRETGLRNLQCIRAGRVVVVPGDWILRPGPRLTEGIRALHRQHNDLQETFLPHSTTRASAPKP